MKKILLLAVSFLFISSAASAVDYFGVYTDAFGSACNLAPGFSATATVIHHVWTPGGATAARFKVLPPPGSALLGFATPFAASGSISVDLMVAYGDCLVGQVVIGTITATWVEGRGQVVGADMQPCLITTDCNFDSYCAKGGFFWVGPSGGCGQVATENTTWGKVKSLYR